MAPRFNRGAFTETLSMAATGLCWLNCSVLPPLLAVLPAMEFLPSHLVHTMHHVLHAAALYFVVPVGALSIGLAYSKHRAVHVTAVGAAGLGMIFAAHHPFDLHLIPSSYEASAATLGSLLLVGAQLYGRRLALKAGTKSCCHAPQAGQGTHDKLQ